MTTLLNLQYRTLRAIRVHSLLSDPIVGDSVHRSV